MDGATEGLEELIDVLSRSDKRALESRLIRLLQHIIQWKVQHERTFLHAFARYLNAPALPSDCHK